MLSRRDHLLVLAEKIATDFFLAMLNPKYRGPKFDFDTFDIEHWVATHIGMSFAKEPTNKELEMVRKRARYTWKYCIDTVGEGVPR